MRRARSKPRGQPHPEKKPAEVREGTLGQELGKGGRLPSTRERDSS